MNIRKFNSQPKGISNYSELFNNKKVDKLIYGQDIMKKSLKLCI